MDLTTSAILLSCLGITIGCIALYISVHNRKESKYNAKIEGNRITDSKGNEYYRKFNNDFKD